MSPNLIGAYGEWAAGIVEDKPGRLSLRSGKFDGLNAWRGIASTRVWECLAAPDLPETPAVRVDSREDVDGLSIEKLSWQLPYGPRTEAVFLKPANTGNRKLPGVLGLHDHGGMKYFGWRKIAQTSEAPHPLIVSLRKQCYEGLAWANELAKRGYAVLVPDTFTFGSRRVLISDTLPEIHRGISDPGPDEQSDKVDAYNRWAGEHEHIMAKSLFSAGTSWPGITVREDQTALSILSARPEVNPERLGCAGLSGGGLRTVYLAGLDERINCCVCVGFMTTWKDQVLHKSFTHTWMTFVPLTARDMEFPEILGLRAPKPALVLHCTSDPLFTNSEVEKCGQILKDVYHRAGASDAFKYSFYTGGHKFDAAMQQEAFQWFDKWLTKA